MLATVRPGRGRLQARAKNRNQLAQPRGPSPAAPPATAVVNHRRRRQASNTAPPWDPFRLAPRSPGRLPQCRRTTRTSPTPDSCSRSLRTRRASCSTEPPKSGLRPSWDLLLLGARPRPPAAGSCDRAADHQAYRAGPCGTFDPITSTFQTPSPVRSRESARRCSRVSRLARAPPAWLPTRTVPSGAVTANPVEMEAGPDLTLDNRY